jgi:hypothetical protein
MKVRPVDPNAELDIALDGRSVRASREEPAEVPEDVGESLLTSPVWEEVGEGPPTVDEVLASVGDDPAKARAALIQEHNRGSAARKTLIAKLQTIAENEE